MHGDDFHFNAKVFIVYDLFNYLYLFSVFVVADVNFYLLIFYCLWVSMIYENFIYITHFYKISNFMQSFLMRLDQNVKPLNF